jgi:hypothetical protein
LVSSTEREDGMSKTRPMTSISERLNAANVGISNALSDAEIGKYLGEYGYQTPKLGEGKSLYETADALVKTQVALHGDRRAASARAHAAEKEARIAYQKLSQVARAAFVRDKASLAVLGLAGPMPKPLPLFLTMATALFDNASHRPEVAATLSGLGYGADKLAAERAKIAGLSVALQAQEAASGAAQQGTFEQGKAMDALDYWMGAFIKIAKVALRDEPQLLEKLGILKRNSKTPAQRAAAGKAAATREAHKAAPAPLEPPGAMAGDGGEPYKGKN